MRVPNPKRPDNPKPWQKPLTQKQWTGIFVLIAFLVFLGLLMRNSELKQENEALRLELRRINQTIEAWCDVGIISDPNTKEECNK